VEPVLQDGDKIYMEANAIGYGAQKEHARAYKRPPPPVINNPELDREASAATDGQVSNGSVRLKPSRRLDVTTKLSGFNWKRCPVLCTNNSLG
jgi:hypothetical protein